MSFDGLRIGMSGLSASQRALETAAHNVTNVNTDGYSRQRVDTSVARARNDHRNALGPGATGQGVVVNGVSRAQDELLETNLREQMAQLASWETRSEFLARAEQVLGPLDEGTSSALDSFWNAWEELATEPDSITARTAVLDAGGRLAANLNAAHDRLERLRSDSAVALSTTVDRINDLAEHIATLNDLVRDARASGDTPNDLLDQRALAVRELTELTGAAASLEDDGDVRVTIASMPIVDGGRTTAITATTVPPNATWPDGRTVAGTGRLGSLLEIATVGIDDLVARVDEITVELRDLVNATHATGYGLDGVTGRDFFIGTDAATFAVDPTLTADRIAAAETASPADGNHALTIGALRSEATSTGRTVGELVNALQGTLGLQASTATAQQRFSSTIVAELEAAYAGVVGVSTDEELADMLRYQRAYEAAARVLTVMDQMLDRLINGTGATR